MNKGFCAVAFVLVVCASHLDGKTPVSPKPDLSLVSTEDLISQFQELTKESVGADSMMTITGFVAVDAPLTLQTGLLGAPTPTVSPIMRELVRRGSAVVPALLEHLSDARPTKLTVGSKEPSFFGGTFYGHEYDPKERHPWSLEEARQEVTSGFGDGDVPLPYHIKVGDLCFATLGQIVNRELLAMRYQPTEIVIINSPVHTPELAEKAREDWKNLSDQNFKKYLSADAELTQYHDAKEYYEIIGALERLMFYYPEVGRSLAVQLLQRTLYDSVALDKLIGGPLLSADAAEQDRLLDSFRAKAGEENYRAVVQYLVSDASTPPDPGMVKVFPDIAGTYANTVKLVKRLFANVEEHPFVTHLEVNCKQQMEIMQALAPFPDAAIDEAARDLLRRTLELRRSDDSDVFLRYALADACVRRMATPDTKKKLDQSYRELYNLELAIGRNATKKAKFQRHCQEMLRRLPSLLPASAGYSPQN